VYKVQSSGSVRWTRTRSIYLIPHAPLNASFVPCTLHQVERTASRPCADAVHLTHATCTYASHVTLSHPLYQVESVAPLLHTLWRCANATTTCCINFRMAESSPLYLILYTLYFTLPDGRISAFGLAERAERAPRPVTGAREGVGVPLRSAEPGVKYTVSCIPCGAQSRVPWALTHAVRQPPCPCRLPTADCRLPARQLLWPDSAGSAGVSS